MLEEEYLSGHRPFGAQRNLPPLEVPFVYTIRDAEPTDLPDVREIYNHYVANSMVTFDEDPWTLRAVRSRYAQLQKLTLPFLVAVSPGGHVLGYAYVYPWKAKAAYRFTAEVSIYLGPAATGKGLGTALMAALIAESKRAGLKELVAVIADKGAEGSVKLHERAGFKEIGRMGRVGFKFNRWLGTVMMQKSLK